MTDAGNGMRKGVWAVLAFAGIYTAVLMVKCGEPGQLDWWPFALGFFAWASVPYLIMAFLATRFRESYAAGAIVLAAAGIMAAGGLYFYWLAIFANPDPQSGLVFVVVPFYQLVAVGIAFLAASAVHRPAATTTKSDA